LYLDLLKPALDAVSLSALQGFCSDIIWVLLQAALCSLLGLSASCAYLTLLQQQVDSVSPSDDVPIWEAEDNVQGFARPFAVAIAAYRQVLKVFNMTLIQCCTVRQEHLPQSIQAWRCSCVKFTVVGINCQ